MKALYLKDLLELKEIALPIPGEHEALIKVLMAGICNTDLEIVKGYMGFEGVLGHEFVGVVEKAPEQEWVGKRVCGEINLSCGECSYCLSGLSRHCPQRSVLGILNHNGAFAEYLTLPLINLHEVSEAISDQSAVFVEPLAAALEILEQVHVEPKQTVAVIGDGKLGLLICQILKLTGCNLVLIGKHERKLSLAEKWGVKTLRLEKLPGEKFDLVVEASGSPSGFSMAMKLVRPRGTLVLKSTYHGDLNLNMAPIVIDEINIVGSRCGHFEAAIRILEQDLVDVQSLIDDILPFDRALEAFDRARQRGALKILLEISKT
ncbi:MAG: alcohol dehydrogenase catalytic domain-containing protein [bacterium]